MANDTISRQAVLNLLIRCAVPENGGSLLYQGIKQLPSAERHGRWIKKYRGNYLCSVCGAWYRTTDDYGNIIDGEMTANYCESCGAKMEGEEE